MSTTTLIWTTLPAGLVERNGEWRLRASVFLSPRLEVAGDEATLGQFPDFADWPRTLRELSPDGLEIRFELADGRNPIGDVTVRPVAQANLADAPESAAWLGVFSNETPVREIEPPPELEQDTTLMSYPAGRLVDDLRGLYTQSLAACLDEDEPPDLLQFAADAATRRGAAPVNMTPLEAFARFHASSEAAPEKRMRSGTDEQPDFHQVVGGLGSYPRLLRKLGLVIDVELAPAEIGLDTARSGLRLRAAPVNVGFVDTVHRQPWTVIDYAPASGGKPGVFAAARPQDDVSLAALELDDGGATVVQEKFEHVAFKLLHAAQQYGSGNRMAAGDAPPDIELPSLVQGGMRVSHAEAPFMMETAALQQAKLLASLDSPEVETGTGATAGMRAGAEETDEELLRADHILRGFRVDVRDTDGGEWRSLCRREVRYEAGSWSWTNGDGGVEDEGTIEPVVYEDRHADEGGLRATEDLFEWDGWSLVVPRDDPARRDVMQEQADTVFSSGTVLNVVANVPHGSLQPQRFGRCYEFRLRNVDLAGNGPGVAEANAAGGSLDGITVTEPVCCLRVESVKPPAVYRATPRGPNESGDVIVLREADAAEYRTDEFRLHVLPPEVPLSIAEKHGLFDGYTAEQAWRLITSHRGSLELDDLGEPREAITARTFYAPYLPDPLMRQAVMILPDGGGTIDLPRFDDIPRRERGRRLARSCMLVVKPGGDRVEASVSGREVTLRLPRGRVHEVKFAAKLTADELSVLAPAHPEWRDNGLLDAEDLPRRLLEKGGRGELPPLAPQETVKFVFATQRPLEPPAFERPLVLPRERASTVAKLADDALRFDRSSTGRIDVYARWEDPVDDPEEDSWTIASNGIYAGGVRIDADGGKPLDPAELAESERSPLAHDFGDTRHREVEYQAVAASRFAVYYPASLTSDADNVTLPSAPVTLSVPATAPPDAPDIAYVIPTIGRRDPQSRDARKERTSLLKGDALRVYMNRGWFSSGKGEQLALVLAHGPQSTERRTPVSEWGENPLRDGAPLPGRLALKHVWGGAQRIENWQQDGETFSLVVCDVHFSEEHKLPFADIEFLSQQAYMPMVRLALARYQENAIDGCHLSPIEQADFVPLTPGRSLTVRKTARDTWHLLVRGYSFEKHSQFSRQPTTVVKASVEVIPRDATPDSLAWQRVGDALTLDTASEEPWHFQWSGTLKLAETDYLSLRWRRRLVVEEFDPFDGSGNIEDRSRLVSVHTLDL